MKPLAIPALGVLLQALQMPTLCAATEPPNVLFIAADDLRPELGCYGITTIVTPQIDAFAKTGRIFRNHFVNVPICAASRYAMLRGLRPTSSTDANDAFDNAPGSPQVEPESWVELLRRNGWHTTSLGKISHEPNGYRWDNTGELGSARANDDRNRSAATFPDLRHSWTEILFDAGRWGARYNPLFLYADGTGRFANVSPAFEIGEDSMGNSLPDEAYGDGQLALTAIEKLREFAEDGTRFCLAVGFFRPHLPFNAPKQYFDLYPLATLPGPTPASLPVGATSGTIVQVGEIGNYSSGSSADRDVLRRAYFASVSYLDAQVGKVLAALDSLGLNENTLVVFWGDHGYCLDDHGLLGKASTLERMLESPLIIRAPASIVTDISPGEAADGIVETVDIYPTIAGICGLTPPDSAVGTSLVPLLRNPQAPGKSHTFSRIRSTRSVRTDDWRLINLNAADDLYDLANFEYETTNVSGSQPGVASDLAALLNSQGTRPGLSYNDWAGGDPLLADPQGDGDGDGVKNIIEYGTGTDGLDSASVPEVSLDFEDLTGQGFGVDEVVFGYTVSDLADDLFLTPETSTDLTTWTFGALDLFDSVDLGENRRKLRFRLTGNSGSRLFFRSSD